MPELPHQSDHGAAFGISDCDNCGALDVPIVYANDEGFEWCADCAPPEVPDA